MASLVAGINSSSTTTATETILNATSGEDGDESLLLLTVGVNGRHGQLYFLFVAR